MMTEPVDLVVCLDNSNYEVALERGKLYALLPDVEAEATGEDYLYPAGIFHKVELPVAIRRAVFEAA